MYFQIPFLQCFSYISRIIGKVTLVMTRLPISPANTSNVLGENNLMLLLHKTTQEMDSLASANLRFVSDSNAICDSKHPKLGMNAFHWYVVKRKKVQVR